MTMPRFTRGTAGALSLAIGVLSTVSCAGSSSGSMTVRPVPLPPRATVASTTDPRARLRAGAATASNMRLVSHSAKSSTLDGEGGARGLTFANSDLAFRGHHVYQGNFSGFQIWDIANPASPVLRTTVVCATGQGDPSIYAVAL